MLKWLFKKRGAGVAVTAAPGARPAVPPPAVDRAQQAEDARAVWLPQLAAAQGDDVALLRLAQASPLLDIKLAAVEALVAEAGLKQAERAFRSHDRRVHGVAKRRLAAKVAEREARARAQTLLAQATALAAEVPVPANRLVALDREWQALDASLLEPADRGAFLALRERLDAALNAEADQQRQLQRWTTEAPQALADLCAACIHAAAEGDVDVIALPKRAAQALCDTRPAPASTAALGAALQAAVTAGEQVEARLAWLAALEVPVIVPAPEAVAQPLPADAAPAAAESALDDAGQDVVTDATETVSDTDAGIEPEAEAEAEAEAASGVVAATRVGAAPAPRVLLSPAQRWRALPALADAALAGALDDRFQQWQRAQLPSPPPAPRPRVAPAAPKPPTTEQLQRLDALLQQAETALAEGQLAALEPPLQAIEATLSALKAVAWDESSQARHHALQAERARLKGWQQWGGGRAREDLLAEAEALARLTLAAADPAAADAPRLHLKTHADAIHALRLRWKELDRLGAAASPPQWQRFDAALQEAHRPVAAQQAALKAARQDNLLAREALLASLEALPLHDATATADEQALRWKEHLRALERFQLAWRPLGPLEHTVPAAARGGLPQRLRAAMERIELPLQEARRAAEAVREQLIGRAEGLAGGPQQPPLHDAPAQLRQLQAEWQQHARQLPLARAVESALWARFKTATDAVFAQREAAFDARDAELAANLAAREALLERASAGVHESDPRAIERALADLDRAWRQTVELPRAAGPALEARFREARAALAQAAAAQGRARWRAECDGLAARLALCEAREAGAGDGTEELESRRAALPALPATWEQALARRWARPSGAAALPGQAVDDALLQLEMALDLPAAAESLAARRELKLRALKDALEGRGAGPQGPARQTEWLAAVLGQGALTPTQRERLQALIGALREAAPGSLTAAPPRS